MSPGQLIFWNLFVESSFLLNLKILTLLSCTLNLEDILFSSGKESSLQAQEYNSSHHTLHSWADAQSNRNEDHSAQTSSQMQIYGYSIDSKK